jgi:L-serine/L-threonine ammonia-lyase
VWLKLENLQPSGSFKDRGLAALCERYKRRADASGVITSSGGNAGMAVARAAHFLGLQAKIVVPESTALSVVSRLKRWNADVIVRGKHWREANDFALSLVDASNLLCHPFDDPVLWNAYSEIVREIDCEEPEAIVVAVGGGGLASGILQGVVDREWNSTVVCAESEGTASFSAAWNAGRIVELEEIKSVCLTLGASKVCSNLLDKAQSYGNVISSVVSDQEAVQACLDFARHHRMLLEPSCGAAVAAMIKTAPNLPISEKPIVVIVCGGSAVSMELLQKLAKDLKIQD